jgi:PEP-CTERM motif
MTVTAAATEVTMRMLMRALGLGILLIIFHAAAVSADAILITDARRVDAGAHLDFELPPGGDDVRTPSVPFTPFAGFASQTATDGLSSAQTTASQRSSVSSTVFSASGTVDSSARANGNGESFTAAAGGSSLFDIEFDLTAPHRFSLTGLAGVDLVDEVPGGGGFGEVDFLLMSQVSSSEVVTLVNKGFRNVAGGQVDFRGIVPAGSSRLQVEASTESVSAGGFTRHTPSFDVTFTLTPTPEPGSLLLVGGGLLALARRHRMRRPMLA